MHFYISKDPTKNEKDFHYMVIGPNGKNKIATEKMLYERDTKNNYLKFYYNEGAVCLKKYYYIPDNHDHQQLTPDDTGNIKKLVNHMVITDKDNGQDNDCEVVPL